MMKICRAWSVKGTERRMKMWVEETRIVEDDGSESDGVVLYKKDFARLQAENKKLLDIIRRYFAHCGNNHLNYEAGQALKGE